MMSEEDKNTSDLDAAESYRREQQAAMSKKTGILTLSANDIQNLFANNPDLVEKIADLNGITVDMARDSLKYYLSAIGSISDTSDLDDPSGKMILSQIMDEVKDIANETSLPVINGDVVFGLSPQPGLIASQLSVMATDASIIEVSTYFLPFCNLVSKLLALSFTHVENQETLRVLLAPDVIEENFASSPYLIDHWAEMVCQYAIDGRAPSNNIKIDSIFVLKTRIHILRAIEVFVVAHEFAHHALDHRNSTASSHDDEHAADLFAQMISYVSGLREQDINRYSVSGMGAAIILCSIDLIARAKITLRTGENVAPIRKHHPTPQVRIDYLDKLYEEMPEERQSEFRMARHGIIKIYDIIWNNLFDRLKILHNRGIRPAEDAPDVGGWLPLG